jgi:hypothetical protein
MKFLRNSLKQGGGGDLKISPAENFLAEEEGKVWW